MMQVPKHITEGARALKSDITKGNLLEAEQGFISSNQELSSALRLNIDSPIRLFDLDTFGVSLTALRRQLSPSYARLAWDEYDVRREQIELIKNSYPELSVAQQSELLAYYRGESSRAAIAVYLNGLSEQDQAALFQIQPYRRKAISQFNVKFDQQVSIEQIAIKPVAQAVGAKDIRSTARVYPEMDSDAVTAPEFTKTLLALSSMVKAVDPLVSEIEITAWQVSIVARQRKSASNSPEGIHQDGADYIISALVIDRSNIAGGTSRVFGPDKETKYLEHTLLPGQGIFQADSGSPLWHDVTPIAVADTSRGEGLRSILGFDVKVVKRG